MEKLLKFCNWLKPRLESAGREIDFSFKKTAILFAVLILFSATVRCIRVAEVALLERDEIVYIEAVERWQSGGFSSVYSDESMTVPPLLLFFTGIVSETGLDVIMSGKAVAVVCGVLFVIPFFFIGRLLWHNSNGAGLLLMTLAAIHPYAIRMAALIERDGIYVMLLAYFFWGIVYAEVRERSWGWGVAGAICALMSLNRQESLELLGLMPCYLICRFWYDRNCWRTLLTRLLFFFAGFAVMTGAASWVMEIPGGYWRNHFRKFIVFFEHRNI